MANREKDRRSNNNLQNTTQKSNGSRHTNPTKPGVNSDDLETLKVFVRNEDKKYHTVETVPKSNKKNRIKEKAMPFNTCDSRLKLA